MVLLMCFAQMDAESGGADCAAPHRAQSASRADSDMLAQGVLAQGLCSWRNVNVQCFAAQESVLRLGQYRMLTSNVGLITVVLEGRLRNSRWLVYPPTAPLAYSDEAPLDTDIDAAGQCKRTWGRKHSKL